MSKTATVLIFMLDKARMNFGSSANYALHPNLFEQYMATE